MKASEIKEYLSLIKLKYHSFLGLLLQFTLISTIFAFLYDLFSKLFGSRVSLWLYLIVNATFVIIWLFSRKFLPKNPKNMVGLTVALHCEDDLESIGVKNDFIDQIKRNIKADGLDKTVAVIKIPNHFCSKVTSEDRAKEINQKVGGHYLIYGEVLKRPDGEEKIFIKMSGLVVHGHIPTEVSNAIAKDFCQSLPKEIEFLDSFRFKGFLLSADLVYLSAKYIIGIAAFVSGDVKTAKDMHERLLNDGILMRPDLPPHLLDIKSKVSILLAEEYLVIAKAAVLRNDDSEYEKFIKLSIQYSNNLYGGHLFNAIKIFTETQDANKSMDEVRKAKELANGAQEWRYSEAFLLFWMERYEDAYKSSKKIIEHEYTGEECTIDEVVVFNERLIERFSDKNQLYFWIGYILYKKRNDLVKALEYFELFEQNQKPNQKYLLDRSVVFLKDIKNEMGGIK